MRRDDEKPGSTGRLCALLGPTNTGKTHRAIERMLDFETGMMGLPLRLLAREVYDRVTARVGEQAVALVTGEEKRIPARPRYWVCTTEAMPLDEQPDFVAIDEIQLMGHPERGHVFTDRLLHARGRLETWFMGSSTVEGLLRKHVPDLSVQKLPRLSRLAYLGPSSIRTLPRRSAVVAFSMPEVYELADALRRRRGGAAVVLGALSPRVRNAQVALYQAGEVDFLVATDAIGMGLNLDVDHVALAGTVKFDGFETRPLESAEIAQIVGRAGRHLRDGTFGTLSPEPELPRGVVQQLEQHRFPAQRFAYYRSTEHDFASPTALLASLGRRPRDDTLRSAPDADDVLVLRAFAKRPELAALREREAVRALWEVCRIPNYEKRLPEHQAEALWPIFEQLRDEGQVGRAYVETQLRRLARFEGDLHVLMDRLAAVRTWTYVTHQSRWVEHAEALRAEARELEDRLSDALHERLLERFVEPAERRRPRASAPRREPAGHHPFAQLAQLGLVAAEPDEAQRRTQWIEELVEARFQDLALSARGELAFRGERVAQLARGPSLLRPALKLRLPDWVEAGGRARIERRLVAHLRDVVADLREPVAFGGEASAPLRGLSYQLERGLGTIDKRVAAAQLEALAPDERERLSERGVVIGQRTVYSQALLAPARLAVREALCGAMLTKEEADGLPSTECLVTPRSPALQDREASLLVGFVWLPSWFLRCDVLEDLLRLAPERAAEEARLLLGTSEDLTAAIMRELPRRRRRRRKRT